MNMLRLRADFNGLFGDLLCLSHAETGLGEWGNEVRLSEGLRVTAFEEDEDADGNRDDLVASGTVERAPDWLAEHGSKWVLRIDEGGIRHESDSRHRRQA